MHPAPHSVRILLVEDSEDDLFFFKRSLKLAGAEAELVHQPDGRAAVTYLERVLAGEERMPDMMFLDLKMPAFTGFEVLEWMGARQFSRPLPVAVLSGSEQPGDVERALALGATAYFVKPILVQQLRTRIADCTGPRGSGAASGGFAARKAAAS
ncbi:MAG TPA: response regulator [Acidobacteriota bacterium]|nr:response regulator [Acidobacteriota bacterium]